MRNFPALANGLPTQMAAVLVLVATNTLQLEGTRRARDLYACGGWLQASGHYEGQ